VARNGLLDRIGLGRPVGQDWPGREWEGSSARMGLARLVGMVRLGPTCRVGAGSGRVGSSEWDGLVRPGKSVVLCNTVPCSEEESIVERVAWILLIVFLALLIAVMTFALGDQLAWW
jgi:hypothetical protein